MKKTLLSISLAVSAALLLTACKTTEPYYSYSFEPNAQIQRAWHRIDAKDIGVEQVRVVKIIDLDCAGDRIAIPGEGEFSDLRDAFANYWKNAFITDLSSVGMLNQEKPKVKLYNLIDSVKIIAEPTQLQWRIKMEIFSSNGGMLKQEITYNAPTDGLKNMREGCSRLAAGLDKTVAWSILKTISDPRFQEMVQPGLGYVPSMKAVSITSVFQPDTEEDYWKSKPTR
ncbi:hypothetical protein [uncultured Turicimonas sp.]|uniref:hypothetical protein n=1 Tax=uncultured Turicimonas sp. TaxID=1918607 RepID=UPI002805FC65|nr:hypothetical protein [uncultured Turicimonas sp.]